MAGSASERSSTVFPTELSCFIGAFLNEHDVVAVSSASLHLRSTTEELWDVLFARRWSQSLFRMLIQNSQLSPRERFVRRYTAKRQDLVVMGGTWAISGRTSDRKGHVGTEGAINFKHDSMAMSADVLHTRVVMGESPSRRWALWKGNLCAHIVPGGCKRRWALAWSERQEDTVGYFEYRGQLMGCFLLR